MVRGIEGRDIVDDEQDRRDFVRRLSEVAVASGTVVYAWALMSSPSLSCQRRFGIGEIHATAFDRIRGRLQRAPPLPWPSISEPLQVDRL
jgi:hypothetical protein